MSAFPLRLAATIAIASLTIAAPCAAADPELLQGWTKSEAGNAVNYVHSEGDALVFINTFVIDGPDPMAAVFETRRNSVRSIPAGAAITAGNATELDGGRIRLTENAAGGFECLSASTGRSIIGMNRTGYPA